VKFLVDAQLPPALVRWLREAGHEAAHVEDAGLREGDDRAIWAHAQQTAAMILTKDEDFATRAQQRSDGPVVVWLRVGNTTNRALRAWIDPRLPGIVQLAAQGGRVVEVT
jgi:predicted nuclease of predicted toxin-antitoxin system